MFPIFVKEKAIGDTHENATRKNIGRKDQRNLQ